jgi:hypothetical protein
VDLTELRSQLDAQQRAWRTHQAERFSTGARGLDALLPGGGLSRGTLIEWLAHEPGSGAVTLGMLAAREACREGRPLVVVDRRQWFYPPAAAALGIDPRRTLIVHPANRADEIWAWDQALRSPAVGAVLGWVETLEIRAARRWQLAVEQSGSCGLLIRAARPRLSARWAHVRWFVEPLAVSRDERQNEAQWLLAGRRWRVELLKARGTLTGGSVQLEWNNATGALCVVPSLVGTEARATGTQ